VFSENNSYLIQVRFLLELLPYVSQETDFALKGGTAINLFVRDMPRLSVDIDLAYLPIEDRETTMKNISDAFTRISDSIEKGMRGCRINRLKQRNDKSITKLVVAREGVSIKIEVSPVSRGCVYKPSILSVAESVEDNIGYAEMLVEDHNDLYAGKLCAALDRQHPRDLFDVYYLLKNEGLSEDLKNTFLVYLISSNRPMVELLAPHLADIEALYNAEFLGMTNQQVSLDDLVQTRIEMIEVISNMLTEKDCEFLLSLKRGKTDWSLFPIKDLQDIVPNLPAVRWKIMNLNKMSKQQRAESLLRLEQVLDK